MFIKKDHKSLTIAAAYVDDIIVIGDNISIMKSFKARLHRIFSIKDLGQLNYFLGLEVTFLDNGIVLSQKRFTNDLLRSSKPDTFKKVATPLPLNLKLYSNDSPLLNDPTHYRSLIGKLNFLNHTRPNLSFTI